MPFECPRASSAKGVEVGKDVSLNWTTAQKSDMSQYKPGQFLVFHRPVKGIRRNETVEVVNTDNQNVTVRNQSGQLLILTARQAKSFDVCERHACEIRPGDKLLLTANRREADLRITNGEIVMVDRVDSQKRVHLTDGRVLPADFRQFTHGYAVTAHRSQGKSVDSVIISADGMQKELFYVAASRGRESVLVIMSVAVKKWPTLAVEVGPRRWLRHVLIWSKPGVPIEGRSGQDQKSASFLATMIFCTRRSIHNCCSQVRANFLACML